MKFPQMPEVVIYFVVGRYMLQLHEGIVFPSKRLRINSPVYDYSTKSI